MNIGLVNVDDIAQYYLMGDGSICDIVLGRNASYKRQVELVDIDYYICNSLTTEELLDVAM